MKNTILAFITLFSLSAFAADDCYIKPVPQNELEEMGSSATTDISLAVYKNEKRVAKVHSILRHLAWYDLIRMTESGECSAPSAREKECEIVKPKTGGYHIVRDGHRASTLRFIYPTSGVERDLAKMQELGLCL